MDWLLYAVLALALIVVAMRLGARLLFKRDGRGIEAGSLCAVCAAPDR